MWVLPSPKRNLIAKNQPEREASAAVNLMWNCIHLTINIYRFIFHLIENNSRHDKDQSVKAFLEINGFYTYSLNHANQINNTLWEKTLYFFYVWAGNTSSNNSDLRTP